MQGRMWRIGVLITALLLSGGQPPLRNGHGRECGRAEAAPPPPQKLRGSIDPSISSDGRFVAFTSGDPALLPTDASASQILVWDRKAEHIELASVSTSGHLANGDSGQAGLSADGRFVAFKSAASNLVEDDTNAADDVFVRDRLERVTERISLSSSGEQTNNWSSRPAISGDGRFVAFCSPANNLVSDDRNREPDIFVRDRKTGTTERVSASHNGEKVNGDSYGVAISADGRFVAFHSWADNLVPGDENVTPDVFVRDRRVSPTIRADLSALPKPDVQAGYGFGMSADGSFLAVMPVTLVNWDLPIPRDVDESLRLLVWDRKANASHRVGSIDPRKRGNLYSLCRPAVSADARYIAFDSKAANLVPDDTNGAVDVFVVERDAGTVERVSVASTGKQANGQSRRPAISVDGRSVAFYSSATNLVAGDTNGQPDVFLRDTLTRTTIRISGAQNPTP